MITVKLRVHSIGYTLGLIDQTRFALTEVHVDIDTTLNTKQGTAVVLIRD